MPGSDNFKILGEIVCTTYRKPQLHALKLKTYAGGRPPDSKFPLYCYRRGEEGKLMLPIIGKITNIDVAKSSQYFVVFFFVTDL